MNMGNQNTFVKHYTGLTDREVFKCGACRAVFDIRAGVVLTECNHTFCKRCIPKLFGLATDGIFQCLCVDNEYNTCKKFVMHCTIKEIYSIEEYYSQVTGSISAEDSNTGEIPYIEDEQSTIQEIDSTGGNEESTDKEIYSTSRNEESTSNSYVSTGQNEDLKNNELISISENEKLADNATTDNDKLLKYKDKVKKGKGYDEPLSHEPKNYQDATQCRNPECNVWLYYGEVHFSKKFFTCPDCKQRNCFVCKGLHNPEAISCAEYKQTLKNTNKHSEDLLKSMLQSNEAMLCPNCKETLLKDDGCDFITCLWCKVELCWVTRGFRWGAWGPGDTSGGCRCGVDGIKCHPDCRSCH